MNLKAAASVFAGGMLGTGVRVLTGIAVPEAPALLIVNAAGTFGLAVLTAWALAHPAQRTLLLRLFAGTGLCGSLTTQSAFALHTLTAGPAGGALFAGVSVTAGLAAGALGWILGSRLRGPGTEATS